MKILIKTSLILFVSLPFPSVAGEFSGFADTLLWYISEETSSTWASEIKVDIPNKLIFAPKGISYVWHGGFRAGFDYQHDNKYWNTTVYWTHYKTNANSNARLGLQLLLPEFFSGFLSGDKFFGGDTQWRFTMNTFDFEMSSDFKITKRILLRPILGIKAGSIRHQMKTNWDALLYISTEKVNHDYFGIGPSIGIQGRWELGAGFNLFGKLNTAYMYGRWDTDDLYQRPAASGSATTITTKMNNSQFGTFTLDTKIGIAWSKFKNPHFSIQLAYEMQYWDNQLRLSTFQELPLHGDLTTQGVTCGVNIDF